MDIIKTVDETFSKDSYVSNPDSPIGEVYDHYMELTAWTKEEYDALYGAFMQLKEIKLEDLQHFQNKLKLFALLDFMKTQGEVFEAS